MKCVLIALLLAGCASAGLHPEQERALRYHRLQHDRDAAYKKAHEDCAMKSNNVVMSHPAEVGLVKQGYDRCMKERGYQ